MEGGEVRVAFLKGEGSEREAEGDVVDGVGFLGGRGGGAGNADFGLRCHVVDSWLISSKVKAYDRGHRSWSGY